jgi:hypothetical protein
MSGKSFRLALDAVVCSSGGMPSLRNPAGHAKPAERPKGMVQLESGSLIVAARNRPICQPPILGVLDPLETGSRELVRFNDCQKCVKDRKYC